MSRLRSPLEVQEEHEVDELSHAFNSPLKSSPSTGLWPTRQRTHLQEHQGPLVLPNNFEGFISQLEEKYKNADRKPDFLVDIQELEVKEGDSGLCDGQSSHEYQGISLSNLDSQSSSSQSDIESVSEPESEEEKSGFSERSDLPGREMMQSRQQVTVIRRRQDRLSLPEAPKVRPPVQYLTPQFASNQRITSLISYQPPPSSLIFDQEHQIKCLRYVRKVLSQDSDASRAMKSTLEAKAQRTLGLTALPSPLSVSMMPFIHFDETGDSHIVFLYDSPPFTPWKSMVTEYFGSEAIRLQKEVYELLCSVSSGRWAGNQGSRFIASGHSGHHQNQNDFESDQESGPHYEGEAYLEDVDSDSSEYVPRDRPASSRRSLDQQMRGHQQPTNARPYLTRSTSVPQERSAAFRHPGNSVNGDSQGINPRYPLRAAPISSRGAENMRQSTGDTDYDSTSEEERLIQKIPSFAQTSRTSKRPQPQLENSEVSEASVDTNTSTRKRKGRPPNPETAAKRKKLEEAKNIKAKETQTSNKPKSNAKGRAKNTGNQSEPSVRTTRNTKTPPAKVTRHPGHGSAPAPKTKGKAKNTKSSLVTPTKSLSVKRPQRRLTPPARFDNESYF